MRSGECVVCRTKMMTTFAADDEGPLYCRACEHNYPASLLKAHIDPFDYALGLRSGEIVRFHEARIDGSWVHLTALPGYDIGLPYGTERGIDIRVSDIVWCCDAPDGS